MKQAVMKLIVLCVAVLSIGLVACSTNTRNENTGIGAVTGAVAGGLAGSLVGGGAAVAIGAVGGALIGGVIGHSMDSSDNTRMYSSMDNNPTNQSTTWRNTRNGNSYTVAPTSGRMMYHGYRDCRRFYATTMVEGKRQKVSGVACRQSNGTWRAVSH